MSVKGQGGGGQDLNGQNPLSDTKISLRWPLNDLGKLTLLWNDKSDRGGKKQNDKSNKRQKVIRSQRCLIWVLVMKITSWKEWQSGSYKGQKLQNYKSEK